MIKRAKKRRILITGGTGSVGRALVERFSQNGDVVTFQFCRQASKAAELERNFGATALQLDFEKTSALPRVDFDVLINNAGINVTSALSRDVSSEDWNRTLFVNLTVPFLLIRQCLPSMIKKRSGCIINISSIYGLRAAEGNLPYTVSKHGLSGLTKTIAKENAAAGITCNEICPGPIDSDMMRRIAREEANASGSTPKQYLRDVCEDIPAGRLAQPSDIANLAVFLAAREAAYLTGTSLTLDGGMIL